MTHEIFTNENSWEQELERTQWPESMWPLTPHILKGLPEELQPDISDIRALKYPWEYMDLMQEILRTRITESKGESDACFTNRLTNTIEGPVWFGKGAVVRSNAEIDGPAYIAGHVGFTSLVVNSILMPGSSIGAFGEMKGSFFGKGTKAGHRNGILDSVFGDRIKIGGRAATANFINDGVHIEVAVDGHKVDTGTDHFGTVVGDDAIIRAQVLTMPGKMIGSGCVVDPRVVVYSNVPDRHRVSLPRIKNEVKPL